MRALNGGGAMTAEGIVQATERLYRSLFTAAVGFTAAMVAWGLVIAPFNGFRNDHTVSLLVGLGLGIAATAAWRYRSSLFGLLRRERAWLLLVAVVAVAALWVDGGWRSSYYLASYAAIVAAAVVGGVRWSLGCATVLAVGYVVGLAINGYSWAELQGLKDADSVVANTGGYLIAGVLFALPVAWLGGYVARIHQVAGGQAIPEETAPPPAHQPRSTTADLSVREVQVSQLVAAGLTNEGIGERLFVSDRTVQSHVNRAMKKTGAKNRAELAAIAVREGLVPSDQ